MESLVPTSGMQKSEQAGTQFIDHDSGNYQGKKVVVEVSENGCHNVISHKPNHDGYIRKCFSQAGKKYFVMYHRYKWINAFGGILDGMEVDHKCRNRACCNVEHLQLLGVSEHKTKTNRERYAERIEGIKFALSEGFMIKEIAKAFSVTTHTVRRHDIH